MPHPLVVNVKDERCDVYVGRPSIYGNQFVIGKDGDRAAVVAKHRAALELRMALDPALRITIVQTLRGKRLGCHCAPLPCHADFIAEIANA